MARPQGQSMDYSVPYKAGVVIPFKYLFVNPDAQRKLSKKHVRWLLANWDSQAFRPFEVVEMSPTHYNITDGQHHFEAAKALGYSEWVCNVHPKVMTSAQATLFLKGNTGLPVTKIANFAVSYRSDDPSTQWAKDLESTANSSGFTFMGKDKFINVNCGTQARRILRFFGVDVLQKTFDAIGKAWGGEKVTHGGLLVGVGTFLAAYPAIPVSEVVGKLTSIPQSKIVRKISDYCSSGWKEAPAGRAVLDFYVSKKSATKIRPRDRKSIQEFRDFVNLKDREIRVLEKSLALSAVAARLSGSGADKGRSAA